MKAERTCAQSLCDLSICRDIPISEDLPLSPGCFDGLSDEHPKVSVHVNQERLGLWRDRAEGREGPVLLLPGSKV